MWPYLTKCNQSGQLLALVLVFGTDFSLQFCFFRNYKVLCSVQNNTIQLAHFIRRGRKNFWNSIMSLSCFIKINQLSYMHPGESICKAASRYPQSFSKDEENACAHLSVLSHYYSFRAENREVKALCSSEVLFTKQIWTSLISALKLGNQPVELTDQQATKSLGKPCEKNK